MKNKILVIVAAALCAFAASGHAVEPVPRDLRAALEKYLQEKGDLCLGKFDWPIDVTERDLQTGSRDAVQMPVLERMGIVSSSIVDKREEGSEQTARVTRYELTGTGKKYYLSRDTLDMGAGGKSIVHHDDFCAGKLRLDKIVRWDARRTAGDGQTVTVAYTYRIKAADWARRPEIQRVFPMVGRVVQGEGTLQLEQIFRRTNDDWVAVTP